MKNIKLMILGMMSSVICTILFLMLLSVFLVKNKISENLIPICIILLYILAILIGSIVTTKNIKTKGAIYGFIMSFMYISILYIISSVYIGNFSVSIQSIGMILFGLMIGTIGGIIGVNIK